ncbi:MAG: RNA-dependent RNA polymerase [Plant associated botourmia-like virus 2]|nr:MAG: RNA-dependent RNA polymerase [Plant associated botourmia-like virus 2]
MLEYDNKVRVSYEKALEKAHSQLKELRVMLNTFYDVSLPDVPADKSSIKEFCVGLLEKPTTHFWWECVKNLSRKKRWGIAHSLFLFRKMLPSEGTEADAVNAAVNRLCTPSQPVDPKFLKFIEQEIPRIFRPGWDRTYNSNVSSFCLTAGSTTDIPRSRGGARGMNKWHHQLRSKLLNGESISCPKEARVRAVKDGGKYRVVTSNPTAHQALKPLHDTLYEYISRKNWLLRGDAKPSAFDGFFTKPGEEFVSGDYEAATDNIPFEVYRAMLRSVENTCENVPRSVWNLAHQQVVRNLVTDNLTLTAKRGQLMGSFLSFPFLCLLNYLIFRYSVGGGPVRINGDDIVFRARPELVEKWMENVGKCGLVLSRGKTLRHPSIFTLNSSMFVGYDHHVKVVPIIRSKAYFRRLESVEELKGCYESFLVGGPADRRAELKSAFLKRKVRLIYSSQRSLTRGLGVKANRRILGRAGLLKREFFYLSLPEERDLPPRPSVWGGLPSNWTSVKLKSLSKNIRGEKISKERWFWQATVEMTWDQSPRHVDTDDNLYWEKVREGTYRVPFVAKGGIRNCPLYKALQSRVRNPKIVNYKNSRKVWVEIEEREF